MVLGESPRLTPLDFPPPSPPVTCGRGNRAVTAEWRPRPEIWECIQADIHRANDEIYGPGLVNIPTDFPGYVSDQAEYQIMLDDQWVAALRRHISNVLPPSMGESDACAATAGFLDQLWFWDAISLTRGVIEATALFFGDRVDSPYQLLGVEPFPEVATVRICIPEPTYFRRAPAPAVARRVFPRFPLRG